MKTLYAHPLIIRGNRRMRSGHGFTLLELLVVIGLIGLMTFIAIPAIKGFGQSNKLAAAQRQLSDDIGYARQYAINNRVPVFVVFFAPYDPEGKNRQPVPFPAQVDQNHQAWKSYQKSLQGPQTNLTELALQTFTNVYSAANACYAFYTEQSLGDQPGVTRKRYVSFSGNIWKTLPEGIILAPYLNPSLSYNNYTTNLDYKTVPFPIADQLPGLVPKNFGWPTLKLPVLAFDSQGRLLRFKQGTESPDPAGLLADRYLALGLGTVILPRQPVFDTPGSGVRRQATDFDYTGNIDVLETPRSNYTNSFYRVQALTGRIRKQPWPVF